MTGKMLPQVIAYYPHNRTMRVSLSIIILPIQPPDKTLPYGTSGPFLKRVCHHRKTVNPVGRPFRALFSTLENLSGRSKRLRRNG
jgi:hypothetical protein